MPLFTFDCQDCDETFEELVSFGKDLDEIHCPMCGGHETQKKMSLVARTIRSTAASPYQSISPACAPGGT